MPWSACVELIERAPVAEPRDVVFVHGMYMNGHSWAPWTQYATRLGYSCHAPSWPYHDGDPAVLRDGIDPRLGRLTLGGVIAWLKTFIDGLPGRAAERSVLIGHSIGGLLVQKLVNDGYGRAGVAISPAPPRGLLSFDRHFWAANLPHTNPLAGNRPAVMTRRRFHYTFCNTMSRQDSDEAFERYVVPESRNVPRSILTSQGRIDFTRPHVPLLLLAAQHDHLTPASLIRRNATAYARSAGVVSFLEFAGRSHFICSQDGWQQVADHCFQWLELL